MPWALRTRPCPCPPSHWLGISPQLAERQSDFLWMMNFTPMRWVEPEPRQVMAPAPASAVPRDGLQAQTGPPHDRTQARAHWLTEEGWTPRRLARARLLPTTSPATRRSRRCDELMRLDGTLQATCQRCGRDCHWLAAGMQASIPQSAPVVAAVRRSQTCAPTGRSGPTSPWPWREQDNASTGALLEAFGERLPVMTANAAAAVQDVRLAQTTAA